MSLKDKSYDNYAAFLLLTSRTERDSEISKKANYPTPAVHCAYYSCFQQVVCILKDYYSKEYDDYVKPTIKEKGSHTKSRKILYNCLYKQFPEESAEINELLIQLKELREVADYHEDPITDAMLEKVSSSLDSFKRLVQKCGI